MLSIYALLAKRLIARYPKQTPSKNILCANFDFNTSQLDLFFRQFSGRVPEP